MPASNPEAGDPPPRAATSDVPSDRDPHHGRSAELSQDGQPGRPAGSSSVGSPPPPAVAGQVFGDRLPLAVRYAELFATTGIERGLVGPREAERVWLRHVLNCAVIGEVIPRGATVVDVGSGAGLPGLPLALARPDLEITLLEPMARRVAWLTEVIEELGIPVRVHRGRAEETAVRSALGGRDVVTARAVAPLGRLAGWTLPLLRTGGRLVAMKGETAGDEVAAERAAVHGAGGQSIRLHDCGSGIVEPLTRVVLVERRGARRARSRVN